MRCGKLIVKKVWEKNKFNDVVDPRKTFTSLISLTQFMSQQNKILII